MVAILIASNRRGDPARPLELWGDAAMALNSVTLYAADRPVVHAWRGPVAPVGVLPNPRLLRVRQPDTCNTYGEAFDFAAGQTDADELILMNDDAVLTPSTLRELLADVALIREQHPEIRPGLVACRSNFVPGPQNVRAANGGKLRGNGNTYDSEERILAAERVSPILAYVTREALDSIGGFPPLNWFSDDLMCWDLTRKGYTHFISRAYVHHVGQRTTTAGGVSEADLLAEAQRWLQDNRPDFWAAIS